MSFGAPKPPPPPDNSAVEEQLRQAREDREKAARKNKSRLRNLRLNGGSVRRTSLLTGDMRGVSHEATQPKETLGE